MPRLKHQCNQDDRWQVFFREQHAPLADIVAVLLNQSTSPDHILSKAVTSLEDSPLSEHFGQISAIRAVVKTTLAHNREAANNPMDPAPECPPKDEFFPTSPTDMLPWAQRAVYLLRGVLRYSRRDTALLLRTTDAQVDQLYCSAEKHISRSRHAPFVANEAFALPLKRLNARQHLGR